MMTAKKLTCAVQHQISSMLGRTAQSRGRERVVDHEHDTMRVGKISDGWEICQLHRGVRNCFGIDDTRSRRDRRIQGSSIVEWDKRHIDAEANHHLTQQRPGVAITIDWRDHMVACGQNGHERKGDSCHPGRGGLSHFHPFEVGDGTFERPDIRQTIASIERITRCESGVSKPGIFKRIDRALMNRRG